MANAPARKPLEGIKVVEVAMWAFVPAAGGMLADMGADVIKVEPVEGDPLRGLQTGLGENEQARDYSFESYNRGKRSVTLDLRRAEGREVLHRLLADADVFLTSLLPPARRKMGIDLDSLRPLYPQLIYATGSATGQHGGEADSGGFDSISFWARGGISSSMTPDGADLPVGPPGPAFGDTLGGSMLAGGIAAALAQRAMTGEASEVDVSLLASAMWAMQRMIAQATHQNVARFPVPVRRKPHNVLVNNYRTADGRFVALCMLQADRYWAGFCDAAGRPDLKDDPRYVDAAARRENVDACLADLQVLFESRTLAEWRTILARQRGQWDVVQHVGEMHADPQVAANGYLQPVGEGENPLHLVSTPMQFGGKPLTAGSAPQVGEHSDSILTALGYDEDSLIDLKVKGVVF